MNYGLVKFADIRVTTSIWPTVGRLLLHRRTVRTSAAVAVEHSLKRVSRDGGLKITSGPTPRRRVRETQRYNTIIPAHSTSG